MDGFTVLEPHRGSVSRKGQGTHVNSFLYPSSSSLGGGARGGVGVISSPISESVPHKAEHAGMRASPLTMNSSTFLTLHPDQNMIQENDNNYYNSGFLSRNAGAVDSPAFSPLRHHHHNQQGAAGLRASTSGSGSGGGGQGAAASSSLPILHASSNSLSASPHRLRTSAHHPVPLLRSEEYGDYHHNGGGHHLHSRRRQPLHASFSGFLTDSGLMISTTTAAAAGSHVSHSSSSSYSSAYSDDGASSLSADHGMDNTASFAVGGKSKRRGGLLSHWRNAESGSGTRRKQKRRRKKKKKGTLSPREAHTKALLEVLDCPPHAVSSHSSALTAASSSLMAQQQLEEACSGGAAGTTVLGVGGLTAKLQPAHHRQQSRARGGVPQCTRTDTAMRLLLDKGEDTTALFRAAGERAADEEGRQASTADEEEQGGAKRKKEAGKQRRSSHRRQHRHVDVAAAGAAGAASFNILATKRGATYYVEAPTPPPLPAPTATASEGVSAEDGTSEVLVGDGGGVGDVESAAPTAVQPSNAAAAGGGPGKSNNIFNSLGRKIKQAAKRAFPPKPTAPAGEEDEVDNASLHTQVFPHYNSPRPAPTTTREGSAHAPDSKAVDAAERQPRRAASSSATPGEGDASVASPFSSPSAKGMDTPDAAKKKKKKEPTAGVVAAAASAPTSSSSSSVRTKGSAATVAARLPHRVLHAGLPPLRSHLYYERDGTAVTRERFQELEAANIFKSTAADTQQQQQELLRSMLPPQAAERRGYYASCAPMMKVELDPETGVPLLHTNTRGRPRGSGGRIDDDEGGDGHPLAGSLAPNDNNHFSKACGISLATQQRIVSGGAHDPRQYHQGVPYNMCLLSEKDTHDLMYAHDTRQHLLLGGGGGGGGDGGGGDDGGGNLLSAGNGMGPPPSLSYSNPAAYRFVYHSVLYGLQRFSILLNFLALGAAAFTCMVAFSPFWKEGVRFVAVFSAGTTAGEATASPSPPAPTLVPITTTTSTTAPVTSEDILAMQLSSHERASLAFFLFSDTQAGFFIFLAMLCIMAHLAAMAAPLVDIYWKHRGKANAAVLRPVAQRGLPLQHAISEGRGVASATTMANVRWKRDFFDVYQAECHAEERKRRRKEEQAAREERERERRRRRYRRIMKMLKTLKSKKKKKKAQQMPEGAAQTPEEGGGAVLAEDEGVGLGEQERELLRQAKEYERQEAEERLRRNAGGGGGGGAGEEDAHEKDLQEKQTRELRHDFNFFSFQKERVRTARRAQRQREDYRAQALLQQYQAQHRHDGEIAGLHADGVRLHNDFYQQDVSRSAAMARRMTTVPMSMLTGRGGGGEEAALSSPSSPLYHAARRHHQTPKGFGGDTTTNPASSNTGNHFFDSSSQAVSPGQSIVFSDNNNNNNTDLWSSITFSDFNGGLGSRMNSARRGGGNDARGGVGGQNDGDNTSAAPSSPRHRRRVSSAAASSISAGGEQTNADTESEHFQGFDSFATAHPRGYRLGNIHNESTSAFLASLGGGAGPQGSGASFSHTAGGMAAAAVSGRRRSPGREAASPGAAVSPFGAGYGNIKGLSPSHAHRVYRSVFASPQHYSTSPLWRRLCGGYLSLHDRHPVVFHVIDRLLRPRLWCLLLILLLSVVELGFLSHRSASFTLQDAAVMNSAAAPSSSAAAALAPLEWMKWSTAPYRIEEENGADGGGESSVAGVSNADAATDSTILRIAGTSLDFFGVMAAIYSTRLILIIITCILDALF